MSEVLESSPVKSLDQFPHPSVQEEIKRALDRHDAAKLTITGESLAGMLTTADGDFEKYSTDHNLDWIGIDNMEMRQPASNLHFALRGHTVDVSQEGRTVHLRRSYRLDGTPIGEIKERRYKHQ